MLKLDVIHETSNQSKLQQKVWKHGLNLNYKTCKTYKVLVFTVGVSGGYV